MRRIVLAGLALAVVSLALRRPAVAEDLTIVSTVNTPRGTTRPQTQYLSASRIRLSGDERDTIVDLRSGKIMLLDNRRRQYSETTLDDLRAFLDQMEAAMDGRPLFDRAIGATASVSVEKGTSGRKVAGYDTDSYALAMGDSMRMEVWTTTVLEPPAHYFDARKILYATMGPMGRRFDRLFDEMKKIRGFPLATTLDYRMRVSRRQVSSEATEVRKGPIPDSVFAAPADYTKIESPFGGGRPPRPAPSP
jgi:Domain of unknown function (DUF4412)